MKRKDILQHLEERLARGEISEKTYLDIKARYDAEPETPETQESPTPNLEASIHETVARATEEASRAMNESMRAVSESVRASMAAAHSVDLAGVGVKVSPEEIRITGSGVVSGNPLRTDEFKVTGSARVRGSLECDTARVAGSCDFDGDVRCTEFRSSGSSRIAGTLRVEDLDVSGSLEVAKDLEAEDVSISGALRADGELRCQDFHSSGSLRIQGALKAADVDIELGGSSQVGTIEAQDVSVRAVGGFVRSRGDLTVDRIVGQDIALVGTNAAYVEGQDVRIGPHCHIGVVVAKELVVHESSEVKERRVQNE